MEGTAEAGLEVAQQGVDPPELRQVVGVLAAGDDSLVLAVGSWQLAVGSLPLAVVTARKQAKPSERTWLPGARCRLAQSEIASELKPLTAVHLA